MRISRNLKGLLIIVAGLAVTGCAVTVREPGPPAAGYGSAYGYYDDYYYYPSARVYFQIYTGYYYYWAGNRWLRSRVLPGHIRLHADDRHRLTIKDRYPYLRDHEYQRQYRPRPSQRYNEGDDRRERELNTRRYRDYRMMGDGQSYDRNRDSMPNRQDEGRDPRRELYPRENRPNEERRPELRKPELREERTRNRDRNREDKRMQKKNKKREDKSEQKPDSDDKDDNRKKEPRSFQLR